VPDSRGKSFPGKRSQGKRWIDPDPLLPAGLLAEAPLGCQGNRLLGKPLTDPHPAPPPGLPPKLSP